MRLHEPVRPHGPTLACTLAGSAGWEDTGCASALYTPGPDDVGCTLLLQVVPGARRAAAAADGAGSRELWQGETFVATSGEKGTNHCWRFC